MSSRFRRAHRRPPAAARRGAVLLFVLVLIVVVAAAITKFSERAMNEMTGEGYYVQRERLRADAYSALEATLAVLNDYREIDGALHAPAQGWGDPLGEAGFASPQGYEVTVEFEDENAKLALRTADTNEAAFTNLFIELGYDTSEVQVLTDSLLDWIDEDDTPRPFGAESDDYARLDPPHGAANQKLHSFEELAAVQGFSDLMFNENGYPNERFEQFRRLVSLHSDGTLNVNTTPPEILRLTGLVDERLMASLAAALDTVDGMRGTAGARYATSLRQLADQGIALDQAAGFSVRTQVLGIVVTVRDHLSVFRLRAVIQTDATSKASGQAAAQAEKRKNRQTRSANATVGAPTELEYPFRFLELVEDPPASTMDSESPTS